MPCNNNCNQGRNYNCRKDASIDGVTVMNSTLIIICLCLIGYGVFKLANGTKGQDCAVEVQFSGGVKATYLGTIV